MNVRRLAWFPGNMDVINIVLLTVLLSGRESESVVLLVSIFATVRIGAAVIWDDGFLCITRKRFWMQMLLLVLALAFLLIYSPALSTFKVVFCSYVSVTIAADFICKTFCVLKIIAGRSDDA